MRGKALKLYDDENSNRITPAYAGKSKKQTAHIVQKEDHPRVCGEKKLASSILSRSIGSPPRMRGKAPV